MFRAPKRSARITRILSAITAVALATAAVIGGAATATAAPTTDYVGIGGDAATFDNYGGDRSLPMMTGGESYSGTLTGPQFGGSTPWCWSIESGDLPTGISLTTSGCSPTATFAGTPEAGYFSFTLRIADTAGETILYLGFEGTVESGKTPTATMLTVGTFAEYDSIPVQATVLAVPAMMGTPTGTVEFRAGSTVLGSATLSGNVASTTVSAPSSDIGSTVTITAHYLGDTDFDVSTSTGGSVLLYTQTATGSFIWNGIPYEGATVALLDGNDVVTTDTTDAAGAFELHSTAIVSINDANKKYTVRVQVSPTEYFYYAAGEYNVDDALNADETGPTDWGTSLAVERRTGPNFTDDGLRTPREGAPYSDGVAATGRGTITYSISAGALPAGLSLNPTTGAVTGTPSVCTRGPAQPFPFSIVYSWLRSAAASCTYDFTITADNGYGTVRERFTGTVLEAGVAPTWEDDELPELRVNVAVDDAVLAAGDPTIVYSISAGTLPAGLTLNTATGAITGTPTTAGPYEFTVKAENEFGEITIVFEGDVEAAPDLNLVLDFEEGTLLEDAASTISAEGLQVGSTYTLTMFSTPRVLYTGTVNASGGFTWVVALPADTPVGAHRLVLTGTAANGTPMSATAWFSLRADGRIGAVSYTGPVGGGLAFTGMDAWPMGIAGAMLLLAGAGITIAGRAPRATRR